MTKPEKALVRRALRLLMNDAEGFHDGMVILAKLAGMVYPLETVMRRAGTVTIRELAACPNQSFSVNSKSEKGEV